MTAIDRKERDQQARWRLAQSLRLLARSVEGGGFPAWYCDRVSEELGRFITLANHCEGKPSDPEETYAARIAALSTLETRPLLERVDDRLRRVEIPELPPLCKRLRIWWQDRRGREEISES